MESSYINEFRILSSFYDIKIEFSSIEPVLDQNGDVVGQERSAQNRITMPIALAKEFSQKINAAIEAYEKEYGEIRQVPNQAESK